MKKNFKTIKVVAITVVVTLTLVATVLATAVYSFNKGVEYQKTQISQVTQSK